MIDKENVLSCMKTDGGAQNGDSQRGMKGKGKT